MRTGEGISSRIIQLVFTLLCSLASPLPKLTFYSYSKLIINKLKSSFLPTPILIRTIFLPALSLLACLPDVLLYHTIFPSFLLFSLLLFFSAIFVQIFDKLITFCPLLKIVFKNVML
jgi:hypothetical protein